MTPSDRNEVIGCLALPLFSSLLVPIMAADFYGSLPLNLVLWVAYWGAGLALWHPAEWLRGVIDEEPSYELGPLEAVIIVTFWVVALPSLAVGAMGLTALRIGVPPADDDSDGENSN